MNHLLATIDELSAKQLGDALTSYGVKSPDTKNDISAPFPFNLMFKTSIGPKGDQVGYLRPETAQGLFVNFRCGPACHSPPARGSVYVFACLVCSELVCTITMQTSDMLAFCVCVTMTSELGEKHLCLVNAWCMACHVDSS